MSNSHFFFRSSLSMSYFTKTFPLPKRRTIVYKNSLLLLATKESLHRTEPSQSSNKSGTVVYVFVGDKAFGLLSYVSILNTLLLDTIY